MIPDIHPTMRLGSLLQTVVVQGSSQVWKQDPAVWMWRMELLEKNMHAQQKRERERERKKREGGLDKTTTTTGPRQRSPCSDWFRRLGPETTHAASKRIYQTIALDMTEGAAFSCKRLTSHELQGHSLNRRVKPALSIQLCHHPELPCPWSYPRHKKRCCLTSAWIWMHVIFWERESLWWPLVAACLVDSGSQAPEVSYSKHWCLLILQKIHPRILFQISSGVVFSPSLPPHASSTQWRPPSPRKPPDIPQQKKNSATCCFPSKVGVWVYKETEVFLSIYGLHV